MTDDIIGRRYTVLKPSAWFPRDFTVLAYADVPGILRLQSAVEQYFVAEARFYAQLGVTFVWNASLGQLRLVDPPPPGEDAADELSAKLAKGC